MDPQHPKHPKLHRLGSLAPLAGWLHLSASCYCAEFLTDGFVPRGVMATLASFEGIVVDGDPAPTALALADRMARQPARFRLFEKVAGGFQVHDYLDYNPSRAEVEEMRASRAQAGRAGGLKSRPPVKRPTKRPAPVTHVTMAFEEKVGRQSTEDERASIARIVKRFGNDLTSFAISQANQQHEPTNFALIVTIAKAEKERLRS